LDKANVMEMSEDEILEEADRIRVRRGLRVARECARCGNSFLAIGPERNCSDVVCRDAVNRRNAGAPAYERTNLDRIPPMLEGESYRAYFSRIANRPLTQEDEELLAAMERIQEIWSHLDGPFEDSTELIRREREARAEHLANL
jgi:hypothetical protein